MSILSNIFSRILGHADRPRSSTVTEFTRPVTPRPQTPAAATQPAATAAPAAGAGTGTSGSTPTITRLDDVDVAALLDDLAGKSTQKLDWRHSIVDMMKLLGMDSSLAQRKALAKELGYGEDTADSAKMNLWLHEQVLRRLAENGGRVPQDLLH
jgi:hypothetical protein